MTDAARIYKITLLHPAPAGGTTTTTLDDPLVERLLQQGSEVYRIWHFELGQRDSVQIFPQVEEPEDEEPAPVECICGSLHFTYLGTLGRNTFLRCRACGFDLHAPSSDFPELLDDIDADEIAEAVA